MGVLYPGRGATDEVEMTMDVEGTEGAAAEVGAFDHYARLIRRLLSVPVGLVSLVEPERQVFVGAIGLPGAYQQARETPLSHSFCQYVVKDAQPLVISDARLDPVLADNLAIEDLDVIAYAGWPVTDHTGSVIGSLCAIDSSPRTWSEEDLHTLQDLAAACSAELSQRALANVATEALFAAEQNSDQAETLLALSSALAGTETLADVAAAVVQVARSQLGCTHGGMWLRDAHHVVAEVAEARRGTSPRIVGAAETLTRVEPGAPRSSAEHAISCLPADETNPLGAALLQHRLLTFVDRTSQNLRYPRLRDLAQVGEARAFLPLRLGGRDYGALALAWPSRRSFADHDRVTLAALGSSVAQAVHRALLLQSRVDAALTLQHALLTDLPEPDSLTLTARYLPAGAGEEVGGDWYDALLTPAGTTYLAIGDVAGHDMKAAAAMGQLRNMLRMTSWLAGPASTPARELELLDRSMADFGIDHLATVVLARIEQTEADAQRGRRRLRWANAGHPPPVLVHPDGTAQLLPSAGGNGPMLGIFPTTTREDNEVLVERGSRLLLFTDGLVERRGATIDAGLEELVAAATRHAGADGDDFVDLVLSDLIDDVGDDVALLAVRFE